MLGNKILIIGCAGSGKTTLANKISKILGLPLIHMDRFYWKANWEKVDDIEWQAAVKNLCEQNTWIMDGNYTTTLPQRLTHASSVIYLDTPRWKCLLRAFIRRFKFMYNKNRQDIPEECKDKLNLEFYRWIWNYPTRSRSKTLALIKSFQGPVIQLQSNHEMRTFLKKLQQS